MNKTFIQGRSAYAFSQDRRFVPDPYLFEEIKNSMKNYENMDYEEIQNDP